MTRPRPRSPMLAAVSAALLALAARPAAAVAPCHHVCHLGQGTPLLLADRDELWVRRCTTAPAPKPPGKPALPVCAIERVDLEGKVLAGVPFEATYNDGAFETAHLDGHRVVRLEREGAWTDLGKRHAVEPYRARKSTLRIDGTSLVGAPAAGGPSVRRPLGCAPRAVTVYTAGIAQDGKPEDPTGTVAVVAICADGAGGTREVVAIYRPAR